MSLLARERRYQNRRTQADTQSVREIFRRATSKVESSIRQNPNSFWLQKNLWTLERIAVLIRKKFRVCHHPFQVRRILRQWSYRFLTPAIFRIFSNFREKLFTTFKRESLSVHLPCFRSCWI